MQYFLRVHKAKIHGVPLEQQPPATSTILVPASQVGLGGAASPAGGAAEHSTARPAGTASCMGSASGQRFPQTAAAAGVNVNVNAKAQQSGEDGADVKDVKQVLKVEPAVSSAAELILLKSYGSSSSSCPTASSSALQCPLCGCGEEGFGLNSATSSSSSSSSSTSHAAASESSGGGGVGRPGCAALLEHLVGVHKLAAQNAVALDTLNALVARTAGTSAAVSYQTTKRLTAAAAGTASIRAHLLQSIGARRLICRVCRRSFTNKVQLISNYIVWWLYSTLNANY